MKIGITNIFKIESIKTRLALFYSAAVFVLLTLFALFLYWVTITILHKADHEFLADKVEDIQYILENKSTDSHSLIEEVIEVPTHPHNSIYRYYIRIFDDKHKLIVETPGASEALQSYNQQQSSGSPDKKRYFWYSNNKNDYLLIQAPVRIGAHKQNGFIQITLDISYQNNLIRDHKKLVSFVFAITLFSVLIGWLITRRGLHSLHLLTETVQKITSSSLDKRIDPTSWPKELHGLSIAFNQMLERIETSFLRLKQFSADLSHELRTPITNLIGETEIALSYPHTTSEYRHVMESNLEELQRVSTLIENILFLARAENPQIDLKKINLSVCDEIALVCEYYRIMAEEKNIDLHYQGNAKIHANPDMFRRMINNILSNALKYTPPGGSIKFSINSLDDNYAEITLQDNGVGIAADDLHKIFDRFYRHDSARTCNAGYGLGLSIVKSIVQLHRGTISIVSTPDNGTTISIKLPK